MTDIPAVLEAARADARKLCDWATTQALPLWATRGLDARLGGFQERLNFDGSPDDTAIRRVRVQARQIYVYAHADILGWYCGSGKIALDALNALLERYRSPDGAPGFVHTLNADGTIANPLRDTYDHAFLLLAFTWLARATGDAQVRALVDEVLLFLDEHLACGDGTFHEGKPRSTTRRQNPHMHLFEAMLALHDTVAHPQALARAGVLARLLETHFLDAQTRTLTEYFNEDWTPQNREALIEPGHQAEWSWLLYRHATLAGHRPPPLARHLLDVAMRCAYRGSGLLPDQTSVAGVAYAPTMRCWPQTELAKAWLAQHALGAPDAAAAIQGALSRISEHYLSGPFAGGWIDQLDGDGKCIAKHVPASTFYHLFVATTEANRVLLDGP